MISGSKILIVDDNQEIVDILADFLTLNNCEIHKASQAMKPLIFLTRKDVEIVILDVKTARYKRHISSGHALKRANLPSLSL